MHGSGVAKLTESSLCRGGCKTPGDDLEEVRNLVIYSDLWMCLEEELHLRQLS